MKNSNNHKYYMPVTENFLSFQLHVKCIKIQWVEVKMTEFEYEHYFATLQKALYWNTLNLFHKHVWLISIGELYVRRLEICPGIPSYAVVELFDVCEKNITPLKNSPWLDNGSSWKIPDKSVLVIYSTS